MSNEDNFIINQLSDTILKLHSYRNDIIQINNSNILYYTVLIIIFVIVSNIYILPLHQHHLPQQRWHLCRTTQPLEMGMDDLYLHLWKVVTQPPPPGPLNPS